MTRTRILTIFLFLIGVMWAFFAWILIPAPIGIFIDEYNLKLYDGILTIFGSFQALVGFFIWFEWGFYSLKGRFYKISFKNLWVFSVFNHFLWPFYFAMLQKTTSLHSYFSHSANWLILGWVTINIIISLKMIFKK